MKRIIFFCLLLALTIISAFAYFFTQGKLSLLTPEGFIAEYQRNLIITVISLMLCGIVPVVLATYFIAWKYRSSNKKAKRDPNLGNNAVKQLLLWMLPASIVLIICVVVWKSTHDLDPYKPLNNTTPITVQVIALRWKWLFIYPKEKIATVNFLEIPQNIPIRFVLTADAPMSSFWIPKLGGQIYAMTGMGTQLNLIAEKTGDFDGSAAEINGKGFADMRFKTRVVSLQDFESWVEKVQTSSDVLTQGEYDYLSKPSENNEARFYILKELNLYNEVMEQYMHKSQIYSNTDK